MDNYIGGHASLPHSLPEQDTIDMNMALPNLNVRRPFERTGFGIYSKIYKFTDNIRDSGF